MTPTAAHVLAFVAAHSGPLVSLRGVPLDWPRCRHCGEVTQPLWRWCRECCKLYMRCVRARRRGRMWEIEQTRAAFEGRATNPFFEAL